MIYLDIHESLDLEKYIKRKEVVERKALNVLDLADIYWIGLDGTHQLENKCVDEIIDNEDHVEVQLRKQYPNAQHCGLIVRDIAMPSRGGTTVYHPMPRKFKRGWHSGTTHLKYASWLESIRQTGIDVIEVPTIEAVAWRVIAMYRHSMRCDHDTLQRHIRPKITLKTHNPHILALMGLSAAFGWDIGEKKATRLIERFGTVWAVLNSDKEMLCKTEGIGGLTAEKILELPRNPLATRPERSSTGGLSVVLFKAGAQRRKHAT